MTNHASHYVFVYGSLRRGFQSPAHEYISHYFNFFGDAKVKGKLFDLGEHPGGGTDQNLSDHAVELRKSLWITGERCIDYNTIEIAHSTQRVTMAGLPRRFTRKQETCT